MTEFYITLSKEEIARQIAFLLNSYNRLYRTHHANSILSGTSNYFVETFCNKVIGCAATDVTHPTLTKIKHVSVYEEYRARGVGTRLLDTAINSCNTPHVYAGIRDDNIPSLKLFESKGFVFVRQDWKKDHYIITVGRKKDG